MTVKMFATNVNALQNLKSMNLRNHENTKLQKTKKFHVHKNFMVFTQWQRWEAQRTCIKT